MPARCRASKLIWTYREAMIPDAMPNRCWWTGAKVDGLKSSGDGLDAALVVDAYGQVLHI